MKVTGMAVKLLSEVEINHWLSNQHEFNGSAQLKALFGNSRKTFIAKCMFLDNNGIKTCSTNLTWYDARENHPSRSEYRLYYDSSFFSNLLKAGDTMVVTIDADNHVCIFIIADGTEIAKCLTRILSNKLGTTYHVIDNAAVINSIIHYLE